MFSTIHRKLTPITAADKEFVNNLTKEKLSYADCMRYAQALMYKADEQDNLYILKDLIQKGVIVPMPILRRVISTGDYATLDVMIDAGLGLLQCDPEGNTVFDYAVIYQEWNILQLLLRKIPKMSTQNKYCFNTPMGEVLLALVNGERSDVIMSLLERGIDINTPIRKLWNRDGTCAGEQTLLSIALQQQHWKFVETLLKKEASIRALHQLGSFHDDFILQAARDKQWDTVQTLIDVNGSDNRLYLSPKSYNELLKIAAGQKENAKLKVQWLINLTLDPILRSAVINQAFKSAISNSNWDVVEYLINEKKADINIAECGQTALIFAARYGKWDMMEWLLANGADINVKTSQGHTIWTILNGRDDVDKIPADTIIYLNQMQQIADIKKKCQSHKNYLWKKYNRDTEHPKVKEVKTLIEIFPPKISKNEAGHKIDEFSDQFQKSFDKPTSDPREKKFKTAIKVILAVVSLSAYGIYRSIKAGTLQFWKSKKSVFVEKVKEELQSTAKLRTKTSKG